MIGRTLAHYEVLDKLGEGGMGAVYRARDTKLGRDVALKMLPWEFAADPERVARFQREARTLATLQDAHVASIYGFEETGDVRFLVMELVEGEDLAQRLARGPLAIADTVAVARQVAAGLAAAHAQGIVHRDLKPANIKVTPDGGVKILDFGLARAVLDEASGAADPLHSPTITAAMTRPGIVLGTAAYMSPEQAHGRTVDARADAWAFGCVVLECLTGRRTFAGTSVSDTLAAVLRDPIDWAQLPAGTPPALRRLLRRCLERDPAHRLHSLADASLDLDDAAAELAGGVDTGTGAAAPRRRPWPWWAATAVLAVAVGVLALRGSAPPAPTPEVVRFTIPVEDLEVSNLCSPTISPDGRVIAYSAGGRLWLRSLDRLEAHPLEGTEGGTNVFWAPGSDAVGFAAKGRLWRLPVDGGRPVAICETPEEFGPAGRAVWGEDNRIIFASGDGGIYGVPVSGGHPATVLAPDPSRDDDFHAPAALPSGGGIMWVTHPLAGDIDTIESLRDGRRAVLWKDPAGADLEVPVVADGYILVRRGPPSPGIWAVPFPDASQAPTGEPILVANAGRAPSVSRDGTLVYVASSGSGYQLVGVDLAGNVDATTTDREGHIDDVAFSPDGRRLLQAVHRRAQIAAVIEDLARGTRTEVATGGSAFNPFWVSDNSIGFADFDSSRIMIADLDMNVPPRAVFHGAGRGLFQRATTSPQVSPDGRHAVFTLHSVAGKSDIWIAPLDGSDAGRALLATPAREEDAQINPAGTLIAYMSDDSGRPEVYVSRFSARDGISRRRWQASSNGGVYPRWSLDGSRLYLQSGSELVEVTVTDEGDLVLGRPRALFDLVARHIELDHGYALAPDGASFLVLQAGDPGSDVQDIIVVQNWKAGLGAR